MTLNAGTRFGAYEIIEQIGSGGMGEVWRAADKNLKRDVAVKVLPESFATDADRLARFRREAEVLASLNHANIATIHGLERVDGQTVIVMELINGPTLADRIAEGPIAPDEALGIARQIADALEAAHGLQIVHRDLKPANIKLKEDGTVKVLDFGISKTIDARAISGGHSPVMTTPAVTEMGVILGTAAYMSPEQARGQFVDQRTDIWAFGCLLFEMLTGQPAFGGEDVMMTLARVLDRDTDLNSIPGTISPAVRHTIKLCLEKSQNKRISDIRDVRLALEGAFESGLRRTVETAGTAVPRWRRALWPSLAGLFALAAVSIWVALWPQSPDLVATRFQVSLPGDVAFAPGRYVRLSPDGRKLAFTAADGEGEVSIWLHEFTTGTSRRLTGTQGTSGPFWSPDSQWLAFGVGPQLKKVSINGGPPQILGVSGNNVGSGLWTEDDRIVFGGLGTGPLRIISAAGGEPRDLTTLDETAGETFHTLPSLLPDGQRFLYYKNPGDRGVGIYVGSLDRSPSERNDALVMEAQFGGVFVDSGHPAGGHLFFLREGTLMARPFDVESLQLVGDPVRIAEQVGSGASHGHFSVSPGGVLAYRVGAGAIARLTWFDRSGQVIDTVGEPGAFRVVGLSPDESKAALFRGDSFIAGDIWILDLNRDLESPFTFGNQVTLAPNAFAPVWSPDGQRIAYRAGTQLYEKESTGVTEARPLAESLGPPSDWSNDGRFLLFHPAAEIRSFDVLDGRESQPLLQDGRFFYYGGVLSPDQRWLAYIATESGRDELWLRRVDLSDTGIELGDGKWQVSRDGGVDVRWRGDGRELIFRGPNGAIMAAEIDVSGDAPVFGAISELFRSAGQGTNWDVTADGQRFLIGIPIDLDEAAPIEVVMNWEALLE